MKIKLSSEFLSLGPFEITELPNLIVLSGINGSGKTHLLRGIATGNIIKVFDDNGKELIHKKFITAYGLSPTNEQSVGWDSIKQKVMEALQLFKRISTSFKQHPDYKINQITGDKRWQRIFQKIADNSNKEFKDLKENDILEHYPLEDEERKRDIFYQNLSLLFKAYQVKQFDNDVNEFRNKKHGNISFLSKEDFIKTYGKPPWELVNKIIEEANLDYYIKSPETDHRDVPYELKLINKINGAEIQFSDLSGGEKVLMSLALALYNSSFDYDFPDVLLMDEPDAPLHPSMAKQFLKVIENVFVNENNVKVIMTTHSPSTVALAKDESLFQMNKNSPRLIPTTKDKALKILTSGVPSLSVNYENRRQVFVESKFDAYIYENIYRKLRDYLTPEISLNFISSGVGGQGDCNQVKEVVNKLSSFGNKSIYGIIDWDLTNNGNEYVKVLGLNKRYSIENYIFDPILLGVFLLREKFITRDKFNLKESESFTVISGFSETRLQEFVNIVLGTIKKNIEEPIEESKEESILINGSKLQLPKWFLRTQGHKLEQVIKTTFKQLERFQREGELKNQIIDKVIDEMPNMVSIDILNVFKSIQNDSQNILENPKSE